MTRSRIAGARVPGRTLSSDGRFAAAYAANALVVFDGKRLHRYRYDVK
jgi:hypothetical protein